MRFYLATLGCKVNQYESQALREAWSGRGCQEVDDPERADVILVNSCAVTAKAVADVRSTVRRLHRAAPLGSIVVTGCAAEVLAKELAGLPGVSLVIGQSRKEELMEGIRGKEVFQADSGGGNALFCTEIPPSEDFPKRPPAASMPEPEPNSGHAPTFPAFAVSGYDRSRAVLKVQDGCSHRCAYCIVPLARGGARSRSMEESLDEAKRLLAAGFREIVISGVNLRQYGRDFAGHSGQGEAVRSGCDFWDLLALLDRQLSPEWAGQARLRISSLEPGQLGQKALDVLGASRMAAPHLHLSLQSGSPSVLRRMGRGHYDPAALPEFLAELRTVWPFFGLGADILTGFPGESEAEFQEGLALCRSLPLTYAHVFPYSRRAGTAAATMDGQLPARVKKERAAVLRAMAQEKKQAFLRSLLALPLMRVVFEDRGEAFEGFSADPGPDAGAISAQKRGTARGGGETPSGAATPAVLRGVNEFYADCRLEIPEFPSAAPLARVLTKVRPLRVEGAALAVSLAESL